MRLHIEQDRAWSTGIAPLESEISLVHARKRSLKASLRPTEFTSGCSGPRSALLGTVTRKQRFPNLSPAGKTQGDVANLSMVSEKGDSRIGEY